MSPTGNRGIFDEPPQADVHEVFRQAVQPSGARVSVAGGFMEFALKVPEPRRALDFNNFPYQREWYDDAGEADRELVIMKGTQVGASAYLVRWALRWADRGRTALLVQPKDRYVSDFVRLRVKPVLRRSTYLRSRTASDAVDNVGLKQVGAGEVAFRGSESQDALDSVAADVLCLDEYDRLVQANISDAEQRVTGPLSEGLIRRVCTPTFPSFGIAEAFERSDKRRWMVRCGCREWQPMRGAETFRDNVDVERRILVCRKCRKPLDVRRGEWVAEHPDRDIRGYHVPKFVVFGVNIGRIVENSSKTSNEDRKTHFNKDLGEPWASERDRLPLEAILAASRPFQIAPRYTGHNPVTMGVDTASSRALNVRVSEHVDEHTKRALWLGTIDEFDALTNLMEDYRVATAVVDAAPEGRLARAFCEKFPGRAYRVRFASMDAPAKLSAEDPGLVLVRRYEAIDAALDLIRRQRNLLPEDRPEGYDDHLRHVVADVDRDARGNAVSVWRELGPIDWLMAEVYDSVATHVMLVMRGVAATLEAAGEVEALEPWQRDLEDSSDDYFSPGPGEDPVWGW